jgi:hypothetical protein
MISQIRMKRFFSLLLILGYPLFCTTGQSQSLKDTLGVYFREIKTGTASHSELWNLDIYGPILMVDPKTRKIFSNFPDSSGVLNPDGELFTGDLPEKINIANTSISWSGRSWAMIMLPLPVDLHERLDLLSHELFHRSQPLLGFHMTNKDNNHLDTREGRVYLRLEVEALRQALSAATKPEQADHMANAMFFRKTRYSLFPGAETDENIMELNEGLATYTGIMMSGRDESEMIKYFEQKVNVFQNWPTFVRSFAYITTPMWGFILSRKDHSWNLKINGGTSLTDYFIKAFGITVPANLCADCINQYGSEKIFAEENERETKKEALIAGYKTLFVDKPHLEIHFENMNISFDPRTLLPLEGLGTVYPTMRISDNWGILSVTGGALLGKNWDKVTVSEPASIAGDKVMGNGWTLELNGSWVVEKNNADGNFTLKKK